MRRLLHLAASEENAALEGNAWIAKKLAALTVGTQTAWKQRCTNPDTIRELELQCISGKIDGVVCTRQDFLEKLLYAQPDFIPPNGRKEITLDDYQGSLLFTPKEQIPVVILNPIFNFNTVNYAWPAAQRFVSKLTTPGKWWRQTPFTWEEARPETIERFYNKMVARARLVGVDIETAVGDPLRRINCISFAAYYPDTHTTETIVIPFQGMFWWNWIKKFCESQVAKVFQNGLYDNLYLLRFGIATVNWLHDTQHLFHSMFSEYPKRLDFLAAYAIRNIRYWKDDGKTGNLQDYYRYNALDSWATVNSYLSLLTLAEPYALKNYQMEFPLVFPCLTCEIEGMRVDMEVFNQTAEKVEKEIAAEESQFQKMIAAPGFNVGSWQQKLKLFHVLGISKLDRAALQEKPAKYKVLGGCKTTGKADMLKAKATSLFNERILTDMTDIIEARKLMSNYLDKDKVWNGRIYYKIDPSGTDTGRLASKASSYWCGFQIQNVPRGKHVKQFLISDTGWLLAEIDKAQSEARCVGYLAGEEALIEVVEGPNDYHAWNAQAFFGVPYEKIYDNESHKTLDKDLRDLSKRTNHGANYNMGEGVMLDTMGPKYVSKAKLLLRIPGTLRQVCAFLLNRYAQTYPKVKGDFPDDVTDEIRRTGKLVSPTGWTRVFFGKPWLNKRDLNAAIAHKPQNLSVALLNDEWYNTWRAQMYGGFYKYDYVSRQTSYVECDLRDKIRIKAQIHDSNMFQYRKEFPDVPDIVANVIMQTRIPITAPDGVTRVMFIPSDISAGKIRWSELK